MKLLFLDPKNFKGRGIHSEDCLHGFLPTARYILLSAHMDGPTNQGPSEAQGLLQTDNSYDDGGAVAVILSMAEYFQNNPTKRTWVQQKNKELSNTTLGFET